MTIRARSGIGLKADNGDAIATFSSDLAPSPSVKPDARYLRRSVAVATALEVSRLARNVVIALQDGAQSARGYADQDGVLLTYADGWAAAATLAQLVAFDALKPVD